MARPLSRRWWSVLAFCEDVALGTAAWAQRRVEIGLGWPGNPQTRDAALDYSQGCVEQLGSHRMAMPVYCAAALVAATLAEQLGAKGERDGKA